MASTNQHNACVRCGQAIDDSANTYTIERKDTSEAWTMHVICMPASVLEKQSKVTYPLCRGRGVVPFVIERLKENRFKFGWS